MEKAIEIWGNLWEIIALHPILSILFGIYAVLCIIFVEYVFHKTKKLRSMNKDLQEKYNSFVTNTRGWNRPIYIFGVMFLLPFKLGSFIFLVIIFILMSK